WSSSRPVWSRWCSTRTRPCGGNCWADRRLPGCRASRESITGARARYGETMTTDETARAGDDTVRFRLAVVDVALRLFADQGYEATSVDEIAEAAGISRRTFFRQFRSKEDVIFADHEAQLVAAQEFLQQAQGDPWEAVCEAAVQVFERFTRWRDIAERRYHVVRRVPALRDREIVTVFRYERLFTDYLRERLPDSS